MCEVDSRPVHGQKGAEWVQTLIQRRIERGGIVRRGGRSDESRGRQPKWPASHGRKGQAAHAVRIGCDNYAKGNATGAFDMSVINMFIVLLTSNIFKFFRLFWILLFRLYCTMVYTQRLTPGKAAYTVQRNVVKRTVESTSPGETQHTARRTLVPKKCTQRWDHNATLSSREVP